MVRHVPACHHGLSNRPVPWSGPLATLTARLATGYVDTKGVRHRIQIPEIVIIEAARVGCPLEHACVLLDKESSGGLNVFGHAAVTCGPVGGDVTEQSYLAYKARRSKCGAQGVGPLQLTWPDLQDRADELGGCWRPEINVRMGLTEFARNLPRGDWQAYLAHSGKVAYAEDAVGRVPYWRKVIDETSAS
ncbi:MAG: hypothetical protein ACRDSP_23505 [Pseudonocardiaceae bacterium]